MNNRKWLITLDNARAWRKSEYNSKRIGVQFGCDNIPFSVQSFTYDVSVNVKNA